MISHFLSYFLIKYKSLFACKICLASLYLLKFDKLRKYCLVWRPDRIPVSWMRSTFLLKTIDVSIPQRKCRKRLTSKTVDLRHNSCTKTRPGNRSSTLPVCLCVYPMALCTCKWMHDTSILIVSHLGNSLQSRVASAVCCFMMQFTFTLYRKVDLVL